MLHIYSWSLEIIGSDSLCVTSCKKPRLRKITLLILFHMSKRNHDNHDVEAVALCFACTFNVLKGNELVKMMKGQLQQAPRHEIFMKQIGTMSAFLNTFVKLDHFLE